MALTVAFNFLHLLSVFAPYTPASFSSHLFFQPRLSDSLNFWLRSTVWLWAFGLSGWKECKRFVSLLFFTATVEWVCLGRGGAANNGYSLLWMLVFPCGKIRPFENVIIKVALLSLEGCRFNSLSARRLLVLPLSPWGTPASSCMSKNKPGSSPNLEAPLLRTCGNLFHNNVRGEYDWKSDLSEFSDVSQDCCVIFILLSHLYVS